MVKSYRVLTDKDRKSLHKLLLTAQTPGINKNFNKWNANLIPAFYYGVFFDEELAAVVELKFDQNELNGLNFGAACLPKYGAKWASKRVFRDVFTVAFSHFKKEYLFAETMSYPAAKSLKTLGFTKLYEKTNGYSYYVLNKNQVLPSLRAA